jgi:hypothetical protein
MSRGPEISVVTNEVADSGDCGQVFRLIADTDSDRNADLSLQPAAIATEADDRNTFTIPCEDDRDQRSQARRPPPRSELLASRRIVRFLSRSYCRRRSDDANSPPLLAIDQRAARGAA